MDNHQIQTDVKYVAKLARLHITESEAQLFTKQLKDILSYITKLNELNTDDVEPMTYPATISNILRKDDVKPSLHLDKTLQNAPDCLDGFFKVPKVID